MTTQADIRVIVADDQAAVREGLVLLLGTMPGITVVAEAGDGGEAVAMVAEHRPDVVLMDLGMPGVTGVEATRRVRQDHPGTQVVVLTTYASEDLVLEALGVGALGYLTKDAIARAPSAAGVGNREISRRLLISEPTVKTHINRIFAKTGSKDRAQASEYARKYRYAD